MNDDNYLLALYAGQDKKGKEKRDFEIVNMLEAAQYYKTSNDKETTGYNMVPFKSKHDYPFAYSLKIGTMVLLYENSPEEVWDASKREMVKRLYKIVGMSSMVVSGCSYATITMRHHEEARSSKNLKAKNGTYKQNEEFRPVIVMLHTQIKALVQGYDFDINELGEIKRLR